MYDELDMALESAFKDGYYQALADMGYEFDDDSSYEDAEEDADIFSEDYFDEAMEGNKWNKSARKGYEKLVTGFDPETLKEYRRLRKKGSTWDRNVNRHTPSSARERLLDGESKTYVSKKVKTQNNAIRDYAADTAGKLTKGQISSMKDKDVIRNQNALRNADAKRYHSIKNEVMG